MCDVNPNDGEGVAVLGVVRPLQNPLSYTSVGLGEVDEIFKPKHTHSAEVCLWVFS